MNTLNLSANLVRLRHNRKITQEQLADFIGVTKASVSKWETGQSTPDITILPLLAAFFDVTVDELIGYQPQLSKEQIQKLYEEFLEDFAHRPFEEVMDKTQHYVRHYYSCYPFLCQICALWLNHYMLSADKERITEILNAISDLCDHIQAHCKDMGICNDITVLQAIVHLLLGRAQDVIDALEEAWNPTKLNNTSQSGTLLTQAYMMTGNIDKADSFTQISMYSSILSLIGNATTYLSIHTNHLSVCEQTISRISRVIEIYALTKLHPNNVGMFEYQAALCYLVHNRKQEALEHMEKYVSCLVELFSSYHSFLHGDDYFTKIEEWFAKLDIGGMAPRNRKIVLEEIKHTFEQPAFAVLEGDPEFEILKNKLKELA